MAQDTSVQLVSPDGHEITVSNPETVNNLVYGQGYRLKGDSNPETAVAAAGGGRGEQTEAPSVPPSTTTKGGSKPPTT